MSLLASAGALSAQTQEASPDSCGHQVDLQTFDLSGSHAVLARALSATRVAANPGSDIFRATSAGATVCADSARFLTSWGQPPTESTQPLALAPAMAQSRSSSVYPRERNDGAMQAAAGFSTGFVGGLLGRWRFLRAGIMPSFVYQQNKPFAHPATALPAHSSFAHPDNAQFIDWPSRFGTDPISTFDLGQSFIRADFGAFSAAFSNENLWLGPAQIFPMLISNTAPGFPHLRIGTRRSVDLRVLTLEANIFWGSVQESEYFDTVPNNNDHLFTATSISIQPKILPGLYLGVARAYHDTEPATGHDLSFYLSRIAESPFFDQGGNRPGNGIGAAYLRWVLPESGFEVYAEWSGEDTPGNLEMALRQPDDTRAYSMGLQKVFMSPDRLWRFYAEQAVLGQSATVRGGRGFYSVYTHGAVAQGHTHRGQLLGAAIGPGSDAQTVGLDLFTGRGRSGLMFERVRYDQDTYYRKFARRFGNARSDVELTLEARHLHFVRDFEIEGVLRASRRYDRNFIALRTEAAEPYVEMNWGTELRLSWRPH